MSTAVKITTGIVFLLLLGGAFTLHSESILHYAFPVGMLSFAFIWIPLVLFYRYDLKHNQREKYLEKLKSKGIDVSNDTGSWWANLENHSELSSSNADKKEDKEGK